MLIIGCGNRYRGDDAAGIMVAEKLRIGGVRAQTCSGGSADLIEAWTGAEDVIVVDAVVSGAPVGNVQMWDSWQTTAPTIRTTSTHGLGLAEAIDLARNLNRLPGRLRIYGIEGRQFAAGEEISPKVNSAIDEVVRTITDAMAQSAILS